jgi:macrolide-specific efflux system membrane fusion protein
MKKKQMLYNASFLIVACVIMWKVLKPVHIQKNSVKIAHEVQIDQLIAPAIIDSLSDITKIPTLQSGLITHINVSPGQTVKKGDILFSLKSTLAKTNVTIHTIELKKAENELNTQEKALKYTQQQLARLNRIDPRAISRAEIREKIHEVTMTKAKIAQLHHQLVLAKANLRKSTLVLSQYTICAPKDGVVLQLNAHQSEFVKASQPILLLGDANQIIVRVSLDERDIQRFNPSDSAYIISSQNGLAHLPLTFVQQDRYIITQERLNSRVQEIVYSINRSDCPRCIAGQQLDVYISTKRTI